MTEQAGITIRLAREADFATLWPIVRDVIRAGDTYAIEPGLTREAVRALWMETPRATYVAERGGEVLGTYYLKTNQAGGGAHVCNAGYMVAEAARGQGIARAMCLHSQDEARELGYLAMQFNFVVETNRGAIALWQSLGFETVGHLPRAFRHPQAGLVDARVMYKWLGDAPA
ncbi:MAG: GNAT family N-acetyltransferase [Roseovarius sp.]|jgi:ribosomal protein S18 acetylase RimI-like enzyme|uniref:GNAT family N-acetyltransferase n=1 Tax=Roseovarius sp. TaxID=1486281 RepID=UPI000C4A5DC9|nr:N-acetyltransferase [Roseovarius sp.]MAN99380.1 GNAT family N-acetyltransferase [Roseovarius sp.]MBD12958.1 GNAT family N-acetyltransferase [Roseovarius sp.]HAW47823.1 GNAT family N-acetyltransferase [Roseovarius sp.]|tara:strand:+ start:308 stop:823 length:516 start_codon:yes stop_codon:yes gene_type:complete